MAITKRLSKISDIQKETTRVRPKAKKPRARALRILFVNAPSPDGFVYIRDINRSGRRSRENTVWPQSSLDMLAAVFPDDDCKIIDCIAERFSYKDLYERMQDFKPDWVVSNPISSTFTHDCIVFL